MAPTGSFMAQNGSLMAFLLFIASIMAHNGFYRNTSTPMQVLLNTDIIFRNVIFLFFVFMTPFWLTMAMSWISLEYFLLLMGNSSFLLWLTNKA